MPFRRMHGVEYREGKNQTDWVPQPHPTCPPLQPGGRGEGLWLRWACCQLHLAFSPVAKERLEVGWCGGRYCFAPRTHLSHPQVSISQAWKVLGLGPSHSVDTEIRAEGTQRTKSVWALGPRLAGAPGTGCSHFLPPPCPLAEEVWTKALD